VIKTSRTLRASVVAPLVVAFPVLCVSLVMWFWLYREGNVGHALQSTGLVYFSAIAVLPLYLGLVVSYGLVALVLRGFGLLTRRTIIVIGSVASILLGGWLACDWGPSCSPLDALPFFAAQFSISLVLLSGTSALWWRVAKGNGPKAAENCVVSGDA
jgi:hypothetical protein